MARFVSGGGVYTKTRRVFLVSGTAREGYAVCYNWDAQNVTAENDTLANASAPYWCDARRVMVEAPSYNNHMHFAGVVAKESDGVVGPNWISIHEPGSVCNIYAAAAASAGIGGDKNTGDMLTFGVAVNSVGAADTDNGKFIGPGLPGEGSAILLSEGSANGLRMAQLLEGPPSGGYQTLSYTTTLAGTTVIIHGFCELESVAAAAGAASIPVADGQFVGQTLVIKQGSAPVNTVTISFDGQVIASTLVAVTAASLDASGEFVCLRWNGTKWEVSSNISL